MEGDSKVKVSDVNKDWASKAKTKNFFKANTQD